MKNLLQRIFSMAPERREPTGAVDAIVTWVDGADPVHVRKRERAMRAMSLPPARRASTDRRYSDNGELRLCLRSLHNYAPWLRTIWLVTDEQVPTWLEPSAAEQAGIRLVDHSHIFRGHEDCLPTFNSLSIESMMWRIEGLADRFIYFNDDMFLTGPVRASDFFTDDAVYVRGRWADFSERPIGLYVQGQLNAEQMLGLPRSRHFVSSHVTYAMLRPVLAELFERFEPEFVANARYPFRDSAQFQLLALHNAHVMGTGRGVARSGDDTVHFPLEFCEKASARQIRRRIAKLARQGTIAGCINYAEAVIPKVDGLFGRLAEIAGPPGPFERQDW